MELDQSDILAAQLGSPSLPQSQSPAKNKGGRPPKGAPHSFAHTRRKVEKPRDILFLLEDALHDLRRSESRSDIMEQSERSRAIAYVCRAWIDSYETFILAEKAEAQQRQLDILLARSQPQGGNGALMH